MYPFETERLQIMPAQAGHLRALLANPAQFEQRFAYGVSPQYIKYPEMFYPVLAALESDPEIAAWWMHLLIHKADQVLVGTAGYKGRPHNREVEIGYSVAPAYRNQGLATEAVRTLTINAKNRPHKRDGLEQRIEKVIAHTQARNNASTSVLRKCAFICTGEVYHNEDGILWRWEHT